MVAQENEEKALMLYTLPVAAEGQSKENENGREQPRHLQSPD